MPQLDKSIFRFGDLQVDPTLDEIRKDGVTIKLEPRITRLLVCLAERAGRVVSVEELLDLVWKDVVVSPDSVYRAVALLRRTLGDDAKEPKYIANVMRRGYRVVAPVSECAETPAKTLSIDAVPSLSAVSPPLPLASDWAPERRRLRRLTTALVVTMLALALGYFAVQQLRRSERSATAAGSPVPSLPIVSDSSVAVLPFLDLSEKKDQEYFADGMAEELINVLSQVPDLHVPARTSSFYFKGKHVTLTEVARALGVAHILEGSVRRSGDKLRITAQLIRADSGFHLWSNSYDRELSDVITIQKEIAAAVAQALKVTLQTGRISTPPGIHNAHAYDLYLQARSLIFQAGPRSVTMKIIELLEQSLHEDPSFAPAWAFLCDAQDKLYDYDNTLHERLKGEADAKHSALQALALDKNLPEAHIAMARVLMNERNWDAGLIEVNRALELDPQNPYGLFKMGSFLLATGHLDKAQEFLDRGVARDPFNPHMYNDLGVVRYASGQYSSADIALRKCLDLDPQEQEIHWSIGANLLADSRPAEALEEFEHEPSERIRMQGRAIALYALGRRVEADSALDELEKHYSDTAPYGIAQVRAFRKDINKAFAALNRAYEERAGDLWTVKVDPLFKNLHSDPRFTDLLRKMNLAD